ncbi:hypothetical protein GJAV_G00052000 [Gymnothorax javanicus]|nr:hypothetical protein GJAV_G00052000 [Gymnothorax javanicus]
MQCVGQNQRLNTAVLLLQTWAWVRTVSTAAPPKIDGKLHSAITLHENVTHQFNCQTEGWNPEAPPLLTWYLNGERQEEASDSRTGQLLTTSQKASRVPKGGVKRNSTFTLRARKWDRDLVCAVSNPQHGESYNATVILNVQFLPEIVRVDAHYSDTNGPGLSLVLFALVRSNPPATITWVDSSGRPVANSSDFLVMDSRSYPWLMNHTMRVTLSSLAGNLSINANNSLGASQSNLTLAEFLQSSVEVPMLTIIAGGAVGFITLLILTLLLLFLLHKTKGKDVEKPVEITITKSESHNVKAGKVYLPRENMSLPWNMPLNDLNHLCKGKGEHRHNPGGRRREGEQEEEDLAAAYAARGFSQFPMVGYIYKVNSMSSDEIWL